MNKGRKWPKILLIAAVAVAVLAIGGSLLARYLERQQWIFQTVDTQGMADARKLDGLGRITANSLLPEKQTKEKCTLYNVMLYPSVHTATCTVEIPEQIEEFAVYLVAEDGTVYPGWYNPESAGDNSTVRHGIAKVAFQNLGTTQLIRLDVVNQAEVNGRYTADSSVTKISYELTPPLPLESVSSSNP